MSSFLVTEDGGLTGAGYGVFILVGILLLIAAAVVAAEVISRHLKDQMQEKSAGHITGEHLTMVLSSTAPMTVANHWNLPAVPDR